MFRLKKNLIFFFAASLVYFAAILYSTTTNQESGQNPLVQPTFTSIAVVSSSTIPSGTIKAPPDTPSQAPAEKTVPQTATRQFVRLFYCQNNDKAVASFLKN